MAICGDSSDLIESNEDELVQLTSTVHRGDIHNNLLSSAYLSLYISCASSWFLNLLTSRSLLFFPDRRGALHSFGERVSRSMSDV